MHTTGNKMYCRLGFNNNFYPFDCWKLGKKIQIEKNVENVRRKKNVQHQVVIDLFSFRMFNKKKFAFNLLCILYVSPSTRMYKRILNPLISKRVEYEKKMLNRWTSTTPLHNGIYITFTTAWQITIKMSR